MQSILQWESDHGWTNTQGRTGFFANVLARQLANAPAAAGASPDCATFRRGFSNYENRDTARRRELVVRTRQWLQKLRLETEKPAKEAQDRASKPRLRLRTSSAGSSATAPSVSTALCAETPLAQVPEIGRKWAAKLLGLGLVQVQDLWHHYPRDYIDYSQLVQIHGLKAGETVTVLGTIRRSHLFISPRNTNLAIHELRVQDRTGHIKLTRFYAGRRYTSPQWLKVQQRQFPQGATVAASGLVKAGPYGLSLQDPLVEVLATPSSPLQSRQIAQIVPVYALTEGLTAGQMRRAVQAVLPAARGQIDHLPEQLRQQFNLMHLAEALVAIHQPAENEVLQKARYRLVFDEFLDLQLGMLQRRQQQRALSTVDLDIQGDPASGRVSSFLKLLPFRLTAAQERVMKQIRQDLLQPSPMGRLLQGDVGSGKTVVAVAALLDVIDGGGQGVLMAPTEVLAEQHYRKLCDWMAQLHVPVDLLTGSTSQRRRQRLLADVGNGATRLLVGTHALLESPVTFANLGLVVIDEQHRFGVHQRNRLLNKGKLPHLLSMTATPIPRTLALSIHGDLEVCQIDELPPGRKPVQTTVLSASQRDQAYTAIRAAAQHGQRAYVVLPLVDESEKLHARSVIQEHERLSEQVFPDLHVALLHGRLPARSKQAVLDAFVAGDVQVLVSTTVVEVGVDVPEATVMVIESADRFGLAQLHQLRGRIGRGRDASCCFFVSESPQALARQRLELLASSNDGFEIAEMDLRFRGPGEVLGTSQSGLPDLALASLSRDGKVLEQARAAAKQLLAHDPELQRLPRLQARLKARAVRLATAARLN